MLALCRDNEQSLEIPWLLWDHLGAGNVSQDKGGTPQMPELDSDLLLDYPP